MAAASTRASNGCVRHDTCQRDTTGIGWFFSIRSDIFESSETNEFLLIAADVDSSCQASWSPGPITKRVIQDLSLSESYAILKLRLPTSVAIMFLLLVSCFVLCLWLCESSIWFSYETWTYIYAVKLCYFRIYIFCCISCSAMPSCYNTKEVKFFKHPAKPVRYVICNIVTQVCLICGIEQNRIELVYTLWNLNGPKPSQHVVVQINICF